MLSWSGLHDTSVLVSRRIFILLKNIYIMKRDDSNDIIAGV